MAAGVEEIFGASDGAGGSKKCQLGHPLPL
jgi:hypothetical protein